MKDCCKKKCNIYNYLGAFEKLQMITYKDLVVNDKRIRILGINFMDYIPDWYVKQHSHSFFEFHYIIDHDVYTSINGVEYKIMKDYFYLMPPGTFHSHRQDKGRGHIGFSMRWEYINNKSNTYDTGLSQEFDKVSKVFVNSHSKPVKDDGNIMNGILNLLKLAGTGCGITSLQMSFCILLMDIARFYSQEKLTLSNEINNSHFENNIVENAVRFIEENYFEDIDVYDISNSVHLSYSHLSRLFKNHLGETIMSSLNSVRLRNAQKLLCCTRKSISQIAREVGFSNQYYFSSAFKKHFGVSPTIFRRGNKPLSE